MKKIKEDKQTSISPKMAFIPMESVVEALNVETKTLLSYETKGIVKPLIRKDDKRYYSLNDLGKAKLTRFLTQNKIMNLKATKLLIAVLDKTEVGPEKYFDYIQKIMKKN